MGDGILCTIGINLAEARDVVERIKQEMGVDLVLQPCQLCLCVLGLFVLQLLTDLAGADEVADADGNGCHDAVEQEEHKHPREEANPHVGSHFRHIGDAVAMPPYHEEFAVKQRNRYQVTEGEDQVTRPIAQFVEEAESVGFLFVHEKQQRPEYVEVDEINQEWRQQEIKHDIEGGLCSLIILRTEPGRYGECQYDDGPHDDIRQTQREVISSHCLIKIFQEFLHTTAKLRINYYFTK